jgi:inner membrane protein involved in colicin E2 resistance
MTVTKKVSIGFIALCFMTLFGLELSKWVNVENVQAFICVLIACTVISLEMLNWQGYKD